MGFWRAVLGTGSTPGPGPAAGDAGAEAAGPYAALLPDGEQPELDGEADFAAPRAQDALRKEER